MKACSSVVLREAFFLERFKPSVPIPGVAAPGHRARRSRSGGGLCEAPELDFRDVVNVFVDTLSVVAGNRFVLLGDVDVPPPSQVAYA